MHCVSFKKHSKNIRFLPLAFRRMREGKVFTGVCPSTGDGKPCSLVPSLWSLVLSRDGVALSLVLPRGREGITLLLILPGGGVEDVSLDKDTWDRIGVHPYPGQDDRIGVAPSPPRRRASACYAVGGTSLAVMQEDFLVIYKLSFAHQTLNYVILVCL